MSWSSGLYYRLLARGFDAYAAKMVARHIRADVKPFVNELREQLNKEAFETFYTLFFERKGK